MIEATCLEGWDNWRKKKRELLSTIRKASKRIRKCDFFEAIELLRSVADDMEEVIDLASDQHE